MLYWLCCYIDCPKEGLETVKSNVLDVDESTKSENLLPCALKEIYDGKWNAYFGANKSLDTIKN